MNWNYQDMSEDGIKYRALMKAPDTKFDSFEQELIVGWIIYQDIAMRSSTTDKLREYVSFVYFIVYILHPGFIFLYMCFSHLFGGVNGFGSYNFLLVLFFENN